MNYAKWIAHFRANKSNRPEPQWDAPMSMGEEQRRALALSLAEYQLGDGGGPCCLIARDAEHYRAQADEIRTVVDLWFDEEREHSRLLSGAVRRLRGEFVTSTFAFRAFNFCRRALGVQFEMLVLLIVEIVSTVYYRVIRRHCGDAPIDAMCRLIIRDEVGYIRFHRDRLAAWYPHGVGALWRAQFNALGLACASFLWFGHGRWLRTIGVTTPEFFRNVRAGCGKFLDALAVARGRGAGKHAATRTSARRRTLTLSMPRTFRWLADLTPMTSSTITATVPLERVVSVVAITALLTWLGDFLFWFHPPGVSLGIYFAFAVAALMPLPSEQRPTRAAVIAALLLFCSAWASFMETSFTNVAVMIALLAVLMGERHYREIAGHWARWTEPFVAWLCAPGRWWWLTRTVAESEVTKIGLNTVSSDRVVKGIQILAPAGLLAIIFSVVLSRGNAVFRELLAHLDATLMRWVGSIDLSPARIVMWVVFATFALALIRPRSGPAKPRLWTRAVPQISRADVTVAVWQSCAVFIALNALFFVVNTIDVVYLWGGSNRLALPEHVTFSEFVHQGVYSLILAVLLSAAVIAVIFQQASTVSRHRVLKALGWIWIAQNLLLIAGVLLRLKLYVDAYQLSELRVYVGCFLLLVTTGFALLAWHIASGGSLGKLLWRNVVATFVLFFLVQFPDVAGWVAKANLQQWQQNPRRTLDLQYLESLGYSGWPALCELAISGKDAGRHPQTNETPREMVLRIASNETEARFARDWRSYQWRRSKNGAHLMATAARLSPSP